MFLSVTLKFFDTALPCVPSTIYGKCEAGRMNSYGENQSTDTHIHIYLSIYIPWPSPPLEAQTHTYI